MSRRPIRKRRGLDLPLRLDLAPPSGVLADVAVSTGELLEEQSSFEGIDCFVQ